MNCFGIILLAVIAVVVGVLLNYRLEKVFEHDYKYGILSFFDYNARNILRKAIIVYYIVFIGLFFLKYGLYQISLSFFAFD